MEFSSVCTPQTAGADAKITVQNSFSAACVIDDENLIKSKTDSSLVKDEKSDEELLKGLLTDTYCHVCASSLQLESNRVAHYQGKKHAQKIRVFLQTAKSKKATGFQTMPKDQNHFCELCNMVFTSHVVAKSHYEGKVHAKNLRRQNLLTSATDSAVQVSAGVVQDPIHTQQKSSREGNRDLPLGPSVTSALPGSSAPCTWVDLADPNRYCSLCAACFNNPQMALEHYNGRKHQRNQARKNLTKQPGDEKGTLLICKICGMALSSAETYQAHVHDNKHDVREKMATPLFNSQQKVYNTFSDELADYIQTQKARGVVPKTDQTPLLSTQREDGDQERQQEPSKKGEITDMNKSVPNFLQSFVSPPPPPLRQPAPGSWPPPYPAAYWPADFCDRPPPLISLSGPSQFTSQSLKIGRRRQLSSSSTCSTFSSSSYSSNSSCTSDSDTHEHRGTTRSKRHRRDGSSKGRAEKSKKRRKRPRRERENYCGQKKREESAESDEERRRKKPRSCRKATHEEKTRQQEIFQTTSKEKTTEALKPEHNKTETEADSRAETNVGQSGTGPDKETKAINRKEKKKTKQKEDTRTEEEKLWDDSILGC